MNSSGEGPGRFDAPTQGDLVHAHTRKVLEELEMTLKTQLCLVHQLAMILGHKPSGTQGLLPDDLSSLTNSRGEPRKKRKKRQRAAKDPDMPKKPKTAYLCYVTENMELLRSETRKPQQDIMRMLGENWKALSQDERIAFEKKAADSRMQYERDVDAYKKQKEAKSLHSDPLASTDP